MSIYMRESWETGRFWFSYAARKSWAFDTIFWKYLDKRFFGRQMHNKARTGSQDYRRFVDRFFSFLFAYYTMIPGMSINVRLIV